MRSALPPGHFRKVCLCLGRDSVAFCDLGILVILRLEILRCLDEVVNRKTTFSRCTIQFVLMRSVYNMSVEILSNELIKFDDGTRNCDSDKNGT